MKTMLDENLWVVCLLVGGHIVQIVPFSYNARGKTVTLTPDMKTFIISNALIILSGLAIVYFFTDLLCKQYFYSTL